MSLGCSARRAASQKVGARPARPCAGISYLQHYATSLHEHSCYSWVSSTRRLINFGNVPQVGHDIALSIAANKQDLPDRAAVPDEKSRGFAAAVGAAYYRTSAKTGAGIEQVGVSAVGLFAGPSQLPSSAVCFATCHL